MSSRREMPRSSQSSGKASRMKPATRSEDPPEGPTSSSSTEDPVDAPVDPREALLPRRPPEEHRVSPSGQIGERDDAVAIPGLIEDALAR